MKRTIVMGVAALAVVAASAGYAQAEPRWCTATVSARGHANIEESFPDRLACVRAKRNWSAKVRANCPSRSPWWWRARGKHFIRDAGAGQRYCTAVGGPARRIF